MRMEHFLECLTMQRKLFYVLLIMYAFSVAVACIETLAARQQRILTLPLFPAPLVRQHVPLTKALSDVGVQLREGYVLFGVEVYLPDGQEPTVNLDLLPGSTLGTALDQIVGQLPNYRFVVRSDHLINFYWTGANNDPKYLLNLRVGRFDVSGQDAASILFHPELFIPDLNQALIGQTNVIPKPGGYIGIGPLFSSGGPKVSVHLRDVTVREILNAVSLTALANTPANQGPVGWICLFDPHAEARGQKAYSWHVHWSVPLGWKPEKPESYQP